MLRQQTAAFRQSHTARVIGCALAIFIVYSIFGILQEKITRSKYGAKGEKFHFTFMLVLVQCIANTIFAQLVIMLTASPASAGQRKPHDESVENRHTVATSRTSPAVMRLYLCCAMSYMFAMLSSNYALQFVSYPTQVLAKSCKPIPVMLLGVCLAQKRYPVLKYVFVLSITAGVALFMYNPRKAKQATAVDSSRALIGFGEFLLCFSLFLDGVTGVFQERLRRYNVKSKGLMLWINIFSTIALAVLVVASGELFTFIPFAQRHTHVLWEMFLFASCSALGQYFIFIAVVDFGPLLLSIITTTRKFFSVLFSVVVFGNVLMPHQWLATLIVFAGLLADSLYSQKPAAAVSPVKEPGVMVNNRTPKKNNGNVTYKKSDDETVPFVETMAADDSKGFNSYSKREPFSAINVGSSQY